MPTDFKANTAGWTTCNTTACVGALHNGMGGASETAKGESSARVCRGIRAKRGGQTAGTEQGGRPGGRWRASERDGKWWLPNIVLLGLRPAPCAPPPPADQSRPRPRPPPASSGSCGAAGGCRRAAPVPCEGVDGLVGWGERVGRQRWRRASSETSQHSAAWAGPLPAFPDRISPSSTTLQRPATASPLEPSLPHPHPSHPHNPLPARP